jgi:hypothetical protein
MDKVQIIDPSNSSPYLKKISISVSKINWLMLFEEIIAVYSENHTKSINTLCEQNAEVKLTNSMEQSPS